MTNDAKGTGGARRLVGAVAFVLALGGCASYSGYSLKAGVATEPEVVSTMGAPAMRWLEPDGSVQLAYPRGPAGTQTFMAYLGPDGKLLRIDRLVELDAGYWVLDYKSSGRGTERIDDYRMQVSTYCQAVSAIFPQRPVRGALIFADASVLEVA